MLRFPLKGRIVVAGVFLLLGTAGAVFATELPKLSVVKLAEGVYAVLQPFADRFNDSNSLVVISRDGVLVVDAQNTPTSARVVLAEIRNLTDKPVRYVVFTHWHGDHVRGGQVYRDAFPTVEFVAQRLTREDIEKRAIPELKDEVEKLPGQIDVAEKQLASGLARSGQPLTDEQKDRLMRGVAQAKEGFPELKQTEIVIPTITFQELLTFWRDGREVRLMHFGGHTRGDVVLFMPAEKILMTGDLLDDLPYTGHGSPVALLHTLKEFAKLDFDTIVPGHGGVKHGREHLQLVTALFESMVQQVDAAVKAGLSEEETLKKVDLSSFRPRLTDNDIHAQRAFDFFVPEGIKRAYAEAIGKAPD